MGLSMLAGQTLHQPSQRGMVARMSNPAWAQAREVALAAARAGGEAALAFARRPGLTVEWKSDASPVTAADRASEQAIRSAISAAFPDDAWLGEETGSAERLGGPGGPLSGRTWIVDPIDGTRNFVRGIPLWSVLIACVEGVGADERVVASAAGFPGIGEWYDAARGAGARCNGETISVSAVDRFDQACFAYYTCAWFRKHGLAALFDELTACTQMQRGGGDAWMHMMVASGRADLCVEPGLQVWDLAATSLIVEEAGGRCTDLAGTSSLRSGNAILSNGCLHTATVALIRRLS